MLRNLDILTGIPSDLSGKITEEFDSETISSSLQVSTNWNTLFADLEIWKNKIKRDFKINELILSQFSSGLAKSTANHFYGEMYKKLNRLKNQDRYSVSLAFRKILQDPAKHFSLIACCSDNQVYASIILKEEYDLCFKIAVYARCNNIAKAFIDKNSCETDVYLDFDIAIQSGNVEIVQYMVSRIPEDRKSELVLSVSNIKNLAASGRLEMLTSFVDMDKADFSQQVLWSAAESGSVALTSFLLDTKKLELDRVTLMRAIISGNVKLIAHLFNRNNQSDEKIVLTSEDVTTSIVQSGNVEMIACICNEKSNLKFEPICGSIPAVIDTSCSSEMMDCILKTNDFSSVLQTCLEYAARRGNKEIVSYFLDPKNNFQLQSTQSVLNAAIKGDHFEVVSYLLDPINEFKLEVDSDVYECTFPWFDDVNSMTFFIKDMIRYIGTMNYLELIFEEPNHHQVYLNEIKKNLKEESSYSDDEADERMAKIDMPVFRKDVEESTMDEAWETIRISKDAMIGVLAKMGSIEELIMSHAFFNAAIINLSSDKSCAPITLDLHLYSAYKFSPLYFYKSMEHILKKPEYYQLNNEALQPLRAFMNTLPNMQSPLEKIRFSDHHPSEIECQSEIKMKM